MMKLPKIIVRADVSDSYDERKKCAEKALEAGCTALILREGDEKLSHLGRITALIRKGDEIFIDGNKAGVILKIDGAESMEKAYSSNLSLLIIDTADWKVIPLENLISRFQDKDADIYVCTDNADSARLALETMEVGCSGIVVSGDCNLSEFSKIADESIAEVSLTEAVITKITQLNLGDRVCIDTCSLMDAGDGMLIGSQSSFLFLVCSESFESEYVNARPFRVNAGAVHSYILTPDGTTKYLSEIKAGTPILVRKADGSVRNVSTGRVKIEVRPMILIEAEADGKCGSVILQNAETIRLGTGECAESVSDLKAGDKVLVRLENFGRHFGYAVKETITEK